MSADSISTSGAAHDGAEGGAGAAGTGSEDVTAVPVEVLERQLTSWAANMAAAEARWLQWLAEYDRREGWAQWGCASAAHWLSWKCGMTSVAARERVRVASSLGALPLISAAFERGRLSYSKVRALTRVANPFNEPELCDMAVHASGAQLEAICRGYRRSHPGRTGETAAAHALRRVSLRENFDGTSAITMVLSDDQARLVYRAIQAEADAIIGDAIGLADEHGEGDRLTKRQVIQERDGIAAVRADACLALLTGAGRTSMPRPTDLTMVTPPHDVSAEAVEGCVSGATVVSAEAVEGCVSGATVVSAEAVVLQGERALAAAPARRLCCDPRITALVESASGEPLAVGRATRLINHHLRLALMRRDGGRCQFPGCFATRNLHAHHIVHWADGGPTELGNLVLVCHFHHHLIHDRGWRVEPTSRQFVPPSSSALGGVPVDPVPVCAERGGRPDLIEPWRWRGAHDRPHQQSTNERRGAGLEPPHLDPLDLGLATEILHANEQARRARAT